MCFGGLGFLVSVVHFVLGFFVFILLDNAYYSLPQSDSNKTLH